MLTRSLLITGIIILGCGSPKKNHALENKDSAITPKVINPITADTLRAKDTLRVNKDTMGIKVQKKEAGTLPVCVQQLIRKFQKEEVQNPPRSIYRYSYIGKTVYYVPAPCCDFFSDLYDSACKLIAHPDGGFTGRGDGRAADFLSERKNERLIWKDSR